MKAFYHRPPEMEALWVSLLYVRKLCLLSAAAAREADEH